MGEQIQFSQEELLRRIQHGWDAVNNFLGKLTEKQMTVPTDSMGWTVKDHIIHMAVWEEGLLGLLQQHAQYEGMGLDADTWHNKDNDEMNAIIQQRNRDLSLKDVQQKFQDVHARLVKQIQSMTTSDLEKSYHAYDASSTEERPVWAWIVGNTYGHYEEHTPWMAGIVEKAA